MRGFGRPCSGCPQRNGNQCRLPATCVCARRPCKALRPSIRMLFAPPPFRLRAPRIESASACMRPKRSGPDRANLGTLQIPRARDWPLNAAWNGHGTVRRTPERLRRGMPQREAVEDFRIDFEDGYGIRGDAEEDGHAAQAAQECAKGVKTGTLSPFIGIRIKSLSGELAARALRTLDIFLTNLGSKLPPGFFVTLPKITAPEQVSALVAAFESLEPT